jgi:predicted kinase
MNHIPLHSLVIAVGPAGAGKTTLLDRQFPAFEIISADRIREELTGDFRRTDCNAAVFDHVRHRVDTKLSLGERAVVDACHLSVRERSAMIEAAKAYGVPLVYLVVDRSLEDKRRTAGWRAAVSRNGRPLVAYHDEVFHRNEIDILRGDGWASVIDTRRQSFRPVAKLDLDRPLADLSARGYRGILAIADVHGTLDKLREVVEHARSETLFPLFLGDVLDYGSDPLGCLDLIHDLWADGSALMLWGNHEKKIFRWAEQKLNGIDSGIAYRDARVSVNLSESNLVTVRKFDAMPADARETALRRLVAFLRACRQHLEIGRTMFVHAAAHGSLFGQTDHRLQGDTEAFAMFGQTDGVMEPDGKGNRYPRRIYDWVEAVPAGHRVMVGHDIRSFQAPVVMTGRGGSAVFLDTGCGKGGRLSAAVLETVGDDLAEPVLRTF